MKMAVHWSDMPQKLADILAKNLDLDQDQAEITCYGLQLVWSFLLSLLLIALLAFLTGTLPQAVVGGLTGALVRLFAGGAHSNSPWRCALVGAVALVGISKLAIYLVAQAAVALPYFIVLSTLGVLVAVWLLAPVDSPAKPITDQRERRNLRTLALAVVVLIGLVEAALVMRHGRLAASLAFSMALCLLWQGFSLTATGHRVLGKLDQVLSLGRKEVG